MPEVLRQGLDLPFVVNDLVIQEDSCNLACSYCLTGQSQFKQEHSLLKIFEPPSKLSCEPGTELRQRLDAILAGVAVQPVPVVKISGGEVMLIRGIMELIEELSERYETVVVLTNGIPLSDARLARLGELGNVVLQVSLDSTRFHGNSYRVESQAIHDALMARMWSIFASGMPVEIYMVLNDRSIEDFEASCGDLLPFAERLRLFPFPVRGPLRKPFLTRPEQHGPFFRLLDRADEWGRLMPAPPYLERLRSVLGGDGRTFRCHLPRIAFTAFDDGAVTSCPNIWFNHVANLLEQPGEQVMERLTESPFRRLLLSERPRIDACRACFTPWDPVSLYFDDQLTLDELSEVPVYRGARTREMLQRIHLAYHRDARGAKTA